MAEPGQTRIQRGVLGPGWTPERVVASWPRGWGLAAAVSGGDGARSRWSVIGRPGISWVMRPGEAPGPWLRGVWGERPGSGRGGCGDGPPFQGGWIGWISYDAGRELEPRASAAGSAGSGGAADDRGWPRAQMCRVDDALVYDGERGEWWGIGAWEALTRAVSDAGFGEGAGLQSERSSLNSEISHLGSQISDLTSEISHLRSQASDHKSQVLGPCSRPFDLSFEIGGLKPELAPHAFAARVRRVLEYIRAGDVYQVNLAHRLSGVFRGSPRGLFLALLGSARPWYGGYMELCDGGRARAAVSASPELFLDYDPASRRIVTRPMKGTRPGSADPRELERSEKDRAELHMIVDLMRNDLGRVCEFGSVKVEGAGVERHGGRRHEGTEARRHEGAEEHGRVGILQGVATVSGVLRQGVDLAGVIAAAFPGGSVTGAPKIRAMQIIDELEPVRRGPYCGCFGLIDDGGAAAMSIMIRTALVVGTAAGPTGAPASVIEAGTLDYSAGAGIVADSQPESEWAETLEKARVMLGIAAAAHAAPAHADRV